MGLIYLCLFSVVIYFVRDTFAVLDLVLQYKAKRLARKNVSYIVSGGT